MRSYVVLALAVLVVGVAGAKPKEQEVKITADEPMAAQVQRVEAALRSEAYSEISLEDKGRVQQALGRIQQKMEGHVLTGELNAHDRTQVFNDQEVVNTIMTRAREDSRMVCRRERTTGSNMAQSVCMTVAQRRQAEANGRALLNDRQRLNNFQPGS